MGIIAVVGEICGASGLVVPGCVKREHRTGCGFVSTAILTLKYSDVSMFPVLISKKQSDAARKYLFENLLGSNSCFV